MTQAKKYIQNLAPYQPGLPIELVAQKYGLDENKIIKLASNENPHGPSPLALKALQKAADSLHRYPDTHTLTQAIAEHYDIAPESIIIGNGSNDVLDLVARVYLGEGDESIMSEYAFAVYKIAAQSAGGTSVTVPADGYAHDLSAIKNAITDYTKIIWIANPNNPTGTFIPYSELLEFLQEIPENIMVVLDEAYFEYLTPEEQTDSIKWPLKYPNVIVVRTFSKIYGLAGLRIGYGVASPDTAELLNRVRLPFTNNNASLAAAKAALNDTLFTEMSRLENTKERSNVLRELQKMGLECLPSHGNFVTVKIPNTDEVNTALLEKGIIVRPLKAYGMSDWLRISVGLHVENQKFLGALRSILKG
jgi:histidinol-phosphate aminotransferase